MYKQVEKSKENKSRAVANSAPQKKSNREQSVVFMDNRPEAITQRKLRDMANKISHVKQLNKIQENVRNSLQAKKTDEEGTESNQLKKKFPDGIFLVNAFGSESKSFLPSIPKPRRHIAPSGDVAPYNIQPKQMKRGSDTVQLAPIINVAPNFIGYRATIPRCSDYLQNAFANTDDTLEITNGLHTGFETRNLYVQDPLSGQWGIQSSLCQVEYFDYTVNGGPIQHFYTGNAVMIR